MDEADDTEKICLRQRFNTITGLLQHVQRVSDYRDYEPRLEPCRAALRPSRQGQRILSDIDAAALVAVRDQEIVAATATVYPYKLQLDIIANSTAGQANSGVIGPALANPLKDASPAGAVEAPFNVNYYSKTFATTVDPERSFREHLGLIQSYLRQLHEQANPSTPPPTQQLTAPTNERGDGVSTADYDEACPSTTTYDPITPLLKPRSMPESKQDSSRSAATIDFANDSSATGITHGLEGTSDVHLRGRRTETNETSARTHQSEGGTDDIASDVSSTFLLFVLVSSAPRMQQRLLHRHSKPLYDQLQNITPEYVNLNIQHVPDFQSHIARKGMRRVLRAFFSTLDETDKMSFSEPFRRSLDAHASSPLYSKDLAADFHRFLCLCLRYFSEGVIGINGYHGRTTIQMVPHKMVLKVSLAAKALESLAGFSGTRKHIDLIGYDLRHVLWHRRADYAKLGGKVDPLDAVGDADYHDASVEIGSDPDLMAVRQHRSDVELYIGWLKLITSYVSATSRLTHCAASPGYKSFTIVLHNCAHPDVGVEPWRAVLRDLDPEQAEVDIRKVETLLALNPWEQVGGTVHCEAALAALLFSKHSPDLSSECLLGISRHSCHVCTELFIRLNDVYRKQIFSIRGSHHIIPGCVLPREFPLNVHQEMVKTYGRLLLDAIRKYDPDKSPERIYSGATTPEPPPPPTPADFSSSASSKGGLITFLMNMFFGGS